jgi:hypothetical protein
MRWLVELKALDRMIIIHAPMRAGASPSCFLICL